MIIKSSLIFLNLVFTYKVIASILVVDKGVLQLTENSVGFRFFLDITNENRESNCSLLSGCEKCCLIDSTKKDCDIMTAFGDNIQVVKPRDRQTLLFVAPLLVQHDLVGFCDVKLNYTCNNIKDNLHVKIPFKTNVNLKRLRALTEKYVGGKKFTKCNTTDQDSLNNCEPVNCNLKYLDTRPFFDRNLKKCVQVPMCMTNPDKELPDYVYIPSSNICRNLDLPLKVQDIYAISSGLGVITNNPVSTIDVKVKVKSNCTTISQNLNLLRDLIYGKLVPITKGVVLDYSECFKSIFITIATCIISLCLMLFLFVFCVNTTAWLYLQWSDGNFRTMWNDMKCNATKRKYKRYQEENVSGNITNALLREVVIKDIPLELRNSAIDVCDRMGREVERKRRYRRKDIGSQISLQKEKYSLMSSSSSTISENQGE